VVHLVSERIEAELITGNLRYVLEDLEGLQLEDFLFNII
jgi:hypothetical protein